MSQRVVDVLGWLGFGLMAGSALVLFGLSAWLGTGPVTLGIQAAGIALVIWARATFRLRSMYAGAAVTQGGLVTHGPYRYVRNPIYAGGSLAVLGAVAAHPSVLTALAAAACAAGFGLRVFAEERALRKAFPAYAAYAARTARIVPFLF